MSPEAKQTPVCLLIVEMLWHDHDNPTCLDEEWNSAAFEVEYSQQQHVFGRMFGNAISWSGFSRDQSLEIS